MTKMTVGGAAITALMLQSSWQLETTAEPPVQTERMTNAQLLEKAVVDCKSEFSRALATFYPGDQPGKALDDLSINVCPDYSDFLPRK